MGVSHFVLGRWRGRKKRCNVVEEVALEDEGGGEFTKEEVDDVAESEVGGSVEKEGAGD